MTVIENGVRQRTLLPALTGIWSALAVLVGLWWWAAGTYPFGARDPQAGEISLGALPPEVGPPAVIAVGVLSGLMALVALARARRVAHGHRPGGGSTASVVGTGVLLAVVLVLLTPGAALLTLGGYLMAALGPVVLLGVFLAGARRSRLAAVVLAVLVLVAVVAWLTGVAGGPVVAAWANGFGQGLARQAPRMLALLFLAAGGVLWAVTAWSAVRMTSDGRRPRWMRPERAARWGRVATIVATVCALPYAVARATWLTPWPLGMPAGADALSAGVRLQGLLLGGAALAGAVLTTGLVARWGEVWPRWMPGLRGRPVPPAAAIVPGGLVAILITSAAIPTTVAATAKDPWFLLLFPLPVWGPALGLAVLGYALRRQGERGRPGTIEGP
jgi:hypothetical protein